MNPNAPTGDDGGDFVTTVVDMNQDMTDQAGQIAAGMLPPPLRWRFSRNANGVFDISIYNPATGGSLLLGSV